MTSKAQSAPGTQPGSQGFPCRPAGVVRGRAAAPAGNGCDLFLGTPGAPSQPGGQELAQVAPHFLRAHTRLAAHGTAVAGTSGLSQMVRAPSPDLWRPPAPHRPQQGNEEAPWPTSDVVTYCGDHAKRPWHLGGHWALRSPQPPAGVNGLEPPPALAKRRRRRQAGGGQGGRTAEEHERQTRRPGFKPDPPGNQLGDLGLAIPP